MYEPFLLGFLNGFLLIGLYTTFTDIVKCILVGLYFGFIVQTSCLVGSDSYKMMVAIILILFLVNHFIAYLQSNFIVDLI